MGLFAARLRAAWTRLEQLIRTRSTGYWLTGLVLLVGLILAQPFIDTYTALNLSAERSWLFQHLTQSVTNPADSSNVRLVIIRDDEYWDGQLHHRVPTDRRYLARLIRALDKAEVPVIALDFDLRLPHAGEKARLGDYAQVDSYPPYREETDELVKTIDDVAQRRKIILAKAMDGPTDGPFTLGGDVYQPYGICLTLSGDGQWQNPGTKDFPLTDEAKENISCGYIRLMTDTRRVPPPAEIEGHGFLDAFPLALARERMTNVPSLKGRAYYATYISGQTASDPRVSVSAHDLLKDPIPKAVRKVLQGWPVIVGAGWHERAAGSIYPVDIHQTPIGPISGAVLHANIAEAVLGHRIFPSLPDWALETLELFIGIAAALVFAAVPGLGWRFVAVLSSMLVLFALQWLVLQLFGAFMDAFIPVSGLGAHALVDRLIGEFGHKEH